MCSGCTNTIIPVSSLVQYGDVAKYLQNVQHSKVDRVEEKSKIINKMDRVNIYLFACETTISSKVYSVGLYEELINCTVGIITNLVSLLANLCNLATSDLHISMFIQTSMSRLCCR